MLNLKKHRESKGLSQAAVARELGISRQTYNNYELGKREADYETLLKLADFFDTTVEYLISDNPTIKNASVLDSEKIRMIPLFESVSAGFGAYADSCRIGFMPVYVESDYDAENMLAIIVKGDSMYPKIEDGDTVIVRKQNDFENGDIVVALIDGDEGFVKKIYSDGNSITLVSINPEYQDKVYKGKEMERINIVGVVKKIVKEV